MPLLIAPRPLCRRDVLLLAGACLTPALRAQRAVEIIEFPSGRFTEVTGINDRRQVSGYTHIAGKNRSFLGALSAGAPDLIDLSRFLQHSAFGTNNRGDLVGMGVLYLERQAVRMAFIRRGSDVEPFRVGESRASAACGINDRGDVTGIYGESESSIRSFLLRAGELRPQLLDVPGASRTRAHDISNGGTIVGETTVDGITRGFLFRTGRFETFAVDGATSTHPYGINSRGDVVGWTRTKSAAGTRVRGFIRLATGRVDPFDVPGADETKLAAINARGDLAGTLYSKAAGHVQGFVLLAGNRD